MTFSESVHAYQRVIRREKDTFGEWSMRNLHALFLPYRDPYYLLEDIIHLMMNRLGQDYTTIMLMDKDKRDMLFNKELEIMQKEAKANSAK